jgi:cell division protein ZapA
MSKPLQPVTLNIHGKEYRIACADNERDKLLQAAQLLDQQMRKIHETGKVSGSDRIAVLAALNIAHDLSQDNSANEVIDFTDRLVNLRHKIESVLDN